MRLLTDSLWISEFSGARKMKGAGISFEWTENPLETRVKLSDDAKKEMLSAIHESGIYDTEAQVNHTFSWCLDELERGVHCGDCTGDCITCGKCVAEDYAGIHTLSGTDRGIRRNIQRAFHETGSSLSDALEWLETTPVEANWPGAEEHMPRWTKERRDAITWLRRYGETHGFLEKISE